MDWRLLFEFWHNMANHEYFLILTRYCKKSKLLYIQFFKNMVSSSFLCERLAQVVIWKVVFDVVCHIKRQKKKEHCLSHPSFLMMLTNERRVLENLQRHIPKKFIDVVQFYSMVFVLGSPPNQRPIKYRYLIKN